jgi:hypothetical protein
MGNTKHYTIWAISNPTPHEAYQTQNHMSHIVPTPHKPHKNHTNPTPHEPYQALHHKSHTNSTKHEQYQTLLHMRPFLSQTNWIFSHTEFNFRFRHIKHSFTIIILSLYAVYMRRKSFYVHFLRYSFVHFKSSAYLVILKGGGVKNVVWWAKSIDFPLEPMFMLCSEKMPCTV